MIPDDVVRLPAGWYPDPTGLPQLRWWDNHAWTQHTTAARQPLIVQESTLAWADDLPTRRERRERERGDLDSDDLTPPTAQSLLELAPPSADAEAIDEPAPEDTTGLPSPDASPAAARAMESDEDGQEDTDSAAYQPLSAAGHAGRAPSTTADTRRLFPPETRASGAGTPLFDQIAHGSRDGDSGTPEPDLPFGAPRFDMSPAGSQTAATATATAQTTGYPGFSAAPVSTAPVWVIALFPLLQLVIMLLLVTGLGSTIDLQVAMPAMLGFVYLTMIALAFADHRILRRGGIPRPAHWAWALLTAPVYLFVRAVVLTRTTGRGFGPVLVWFALALLAVASVLAVPGMLITAIPAAFSAQAQQSVAADAAANGAALRVSCPAVPPALVGQAFTCIGDAGGGKSYQIEVSLQRSNGWIDWRVDDWGINTLSR